MCYPSNWRFRFTFNGALCGRRNADGDLVHVRLDLVEVLLAEVLHCVAHGERLKHAHALRRHRAVSVEQRDAGVGATLGHTATVDGRRCGPGRGVAQRRARVGHRGQRRDGRGDGQDHVTIGAAARHNRTTLRSIRIHSRALFYTATET